MDVRKRTGDDQEEQVVSVESKRLRLTTDTTDDDEEIALGRQQQQQLLTTSPVESRFRTLGDQLVPAGDSKKDLTKSVTWSEQLQTVQEVNDLLICRANLYFEHSRRTLPWKWTHCCRPYLK